MTNKVTVALALVAGLLGGVLTRYINPQPVFAQTQPAITKEVRAQSFTLVDRFNHAVGKFTVETEQNAEQAVNNGTRIVLRDASGREIWSAGGSGVLPVNQGLRVR